MIKLGRLIIFLLTGVFIFIGTAQAAPTEVGSVRSAYVDGRIRFVMDLNELPSYREYQEADRSRLVLELDNTINKTGSMQVSFNHPGLVDVTFREQEGKLQAILAFKQRVNYKVIPLRNPARIAVDVYFEFNQRVVTEVTPELKYISVLRGDGQGSIEAHVLELDPNKRLSIKPILSNDIVYYVERVSAMARNAGAVAAVNASYFAPNGEIIGLLKISGQLVSTPTLSRTAIGVMPDSKFIMGEPVYNGYVELSDGKRVEIAGVNRKRGTDELIVYNNAYNDCTLTEASNGEGYECSVKDGKVVAVNTNNSLLPKETQVLSAHGKSRYMLKALKVGDEVNIVHTLGDEWDKTVHAIGAGPRLLKNGDIYLTDRIEEFKGDVTCGRAPRTALGIMPNGNLLLAVVDGRSVVSNGMTLLELALFMQEMGARDAMNLDGGGSSTMVLGDRILNKPSDGQERPQGSALAIVSGTLREQREN